MAEGLGGYMSGLTKGTMSPGQTMVGTPLKQ